MGKLYVRSHLLRWHLVRWHLRWQPTLTRRHLAKLLREEIHEGPQRHQSALRYQQDCADRITEAAHRLV